MLAPPLAWLARLGFCSRCLEKKNPPLAGKASAGTLKLTGSARRMHAEVYNIRVSYSHRQLLIFPFAPARTTSRGGKTGDVDAAEC